MMLVRWDRDAAPTVDNLVLMTKPFAEKVEAGDKEGHRVPVCFEADTKRKIERRLAWARVVEGTDKPTSGENKGALTPGVVAAVSAAASASIAYVAGYNASRG